VRSLRSGGFIPAVIYGYGVQNESLEVKTNEFLKVWRKAGESTLVEVDIDGRKTNVLISDVQIDPLSEQPIHADFHAVRMDEKIKARVPIEFTGESPAVKNIGAVLIKVLHELEVEALPADLPGEITVDISVLKNFGDKVFVKNIKIGPAVLIIADPDEVVILVAEPKKEEEVVSATEPGIESIEVAEKGKKEKEGEEATVEPAEKKS
ncbi:MAG: 50S ribosomal protein L25, partial [Patescibacteria group bacterium]